MSAGTSDSSLIWSNHEALWARKAAFTSFSLASAALRASSRACCSLGSVTYNKTVIWHDTYYIPCNISLRFLINQQNQLFLCELSTFRDKWNNDNFILHKSSRQDKNNSTDPTLGRWNFSLNSLSSRLKIIINRYLNTWHCFFIMDFYYTAKNPIYPWTNFDWANKKRPIILLVKKLAICQI